MQQTARAFGMAGDESSMGQAKTLYLESLRLIERLHRRLLDVIKSHLDYIGSTDVNSVQALLLYNIGEGEVTAGELRSRGYYMGSNVSYNLKKLVELGYIEHQRAKHDRRSVRIRLSDKGMAICRMLDELFEAQVKAVDEQNIVSAESLETTNSALRSLERFWSDQIRFDIL